MPASSHIELICPGLLGPVPLGAHPLPAPALDRALARAERVPATAADPEALLLAAAGLVHQSGQDLPIGAIALLGEAPELAADGFWLCADPVHLRADRDRLLLFAGDSVAPDREEASALIASFDRHFAAEGLTLVAPTPGRWYLRVEDPPQICTVSLSRVSGRSIAPHLPTGPGAMRWMRLLNETQMLFHDHPVNRRRERRGRAAVSGIWTWGGGRLPGAPLLAPGVLVGDQPLVAGLARLAGAGHLGFRSWSQSDPVMDRDVLVYRDAARTALAGRDLAAWIQAVVELEDLLARLERLLRRGAVRSLALDPGDGHRFVLTRAGLRRLWRRQGLRRHLVTDDPS